jgi:hypothetical protein
MLHDSGSADTLCRPIPRKNRRTAASSFNRAYRQEYFYNGQSGGYRFDEEVKNELLMIL